MKKLLFRLTFVAVLPFGFYFALFSQCGDNEVYKIGTQYGSKRLVYNCNTTFLCHEFVRLYFESSCQKPTWNEPLQSICTWTEAGFTDIDKIVSNRYYNLPTYMQVADSFHANVIRYMTTGTGGIDHSQVRDSQYPYKFISKYDNLGPVVGHNLRGSKYEDENPNGTYTFYSYVGPINGDDTITSVCPSSFSVNANSGIVYKWSITSGNSNVIIVSGSSTNSVTVRALQNGYATLQLEEKVGIFPKRYQQVSLHVDIPTSLSGTYDNAGIYYRCIQTTNRVSVGGVALRVYCPNATTYIWQKTSGNINGYFPPGPTISFSMTSGGNITFLVTAKNGSTTLTSRTITFYN